MKALKIDPIREISEIEITGKTIEQQNSCIYDHLGGYFDIVRLAGGDAVMLVDDEGLLKDKEINAAAMMISGYPMLVGVALIVGLEDTPDGEIFTDCPDRYLKFANK